MKERELQGIFLEAHHSWKYFSRNCIKPTTCKLSFWKQKRNNLSKTPIYPHSFTYSTCGFEFEFSSFLCACICSLGDFVLVSFWGQLSPHVESVVFSEEARDEVVQFFQRQDTRQTSCEWRRSQGWLLLKSLLLMTADSSVSDKELPHWFSCYWDYTNLYECWNQLVSDDYIIVHIPNVFTLHQTSLYRGKMNTDEKKYNNFIHKMFSLNSDVFTFLKTKN